MKWITNDVPDNDRKVLCACKGGIYDIFRYDKSEDGWLHDCAMKTELYMREFVVAWTELPQYKCRQNSRKQC